MGNNNGNGPGMTRVEWDNENKEWIGTYIYPDGSETTKTDKSRRVVDIWLADMVRKYG